MSDDRPRSWGRQYENAPLIPPPGWVSAGTDFADAFAESIGNSQPAEFWPEAAGEVLHNILGGSDPEPGPPWTHTIIPPDVGLDEFKPYRVEVEADGWFPEDEPL